MPRPPRIFDPDLPLHVVHRGNNRQTIFTNPEDFRFYRGCLVHASRKYGVAIHAYVLMSNHLHLLASIPDAVTMPRMMQSVGCTYVKYFNAARARSGTLWEGRYRAAPIKDDHYFLACMRYIELNPVRAAMVPAPGDYPWSSFCANAHGEADSLVTPHPVYEALGSQQGIRRRAYQSMFDVGIPTKDLAAIREATRRSWLLAVPE